MKYILIIYEFREAPLIFRTWNKITIKCIDKLKIFIYKPLYFN